MCTISMETVAALQVALQEARRGELTGIAAVEFYEGGYRFVTTGSARENPALTVGTLLVAQVDLARSASLRASLVLESMPLVFDRPEPDQVAPDRA